MVAFYNKADQALYKDYQYLPQEKYRLGLNLPKNTQAQAINTTFGIPATNAFTGSGYGGNLTGGNAFGYGSPVSEVNVRTFNPQSNDPTGKIANAQTMYNKASSDLADPFNRLALTETFTGMRPSKEVMDYYGEQIMDNKEQYGAQGQYDSPYDDTVDQSKYTTTIGSFPSRGFFNRMRNKGFNLAENIPYVGLPIRMLKSFLPEQENRGPGGGTYGIGGLSDAQKTQYNALAKQGFLFDGSGGFKTLTGKNFTGKGYLEGQLNIYDKEFTKPDGTMMTEEEIEDKINTYKNDPRKQFKYKQLLEASTMYKTNKQQEKDAAEQKAKQEAAAAAEARAQAARDNAGTQRRSDGSGGGNLTRSRDQGGLGLSASQAQSVSAANAAAGMGGWGLADGGRVPYINGGGLASIL